MCLTEDIKFCQRYSLFLQTPGHPHPQHHRDLANALLSRHPLSELIDFSSDWLDNEAARQKAAGHFVKIATELTNTPSAATSSNNPVQRNSTAPIFNMANL